MPYLLVSDFLFIVIMLVGVSISLSSVSWLLIWVGMEVSLIGFIPVISGNSVFSTGSTESSESVMKYFVVQAVGSGLILFGGFSAYSASKSWDVGLMDGGAAYLAYVGPLFSVVGLGVKLGVFPFHFWVPSVMAGMSWLGCLVLTTVQKIAPLFFLCILLGLQSGSGMMIYLIASSIGSGLVGGVGGINQTEVRSIMAYSSINHMGWLLMCVCVGSSIMVVYLVFYVLMSFGLFLTLWKLGCSSVGQLNSVVLNMSVVDRMFVIGVLLSYMGMPPFLGFGAKWYAMESFLELCYLGLYAYYYFFLMFMGSLLSLSYYLMVFVSLTIGSSSVYVGNFEGKWSGWVSVLLWGLLIFSVIGSMELIFGGGVSDGMLMVTVGEVINSYMSYWH